MSPMANPPMRLPSPSPASRKPQAACQPNSAAGEVAWTQIDVMASRMPTANWATAPGSCSARSRLVAGGSASRPAARRRKPRSRLAAPRARVAGCAAGRRSSRGGPPRRGRSRRRARTRAAARPERTHEEAGEREADDVGDRLADPQRRVGGQQLVLATICGRIATRAGRKKSEIEVTRKISG